jgi:transposase-like protein
VIHFIAATAPAGVIVHAVWLYFRFPLSLRMVEDRLAPRGIVVTPQTVRGRAEHLHQPARRRERIMKRFKSRRRRQRFLSIHHDPIANPFRLPRDTLSSAHHRDLRAAAMQVRAEVAHATAA